jgi:hypothetical protein
MAKLELLAIYLLLHILRQQDHFLPLQEMVQLQYKAFLCILMMTSISTYPMAMKTNNI